MMIPEQKYKKIPYGDFSCNSTVQRYVQGKVSEWISSTEFLIIPEDLCRLNQDLVFVAYEALSGEVKTQLYDAPLEKEGIKKDLLFLVLKNCTNCLKPNIYINLLRVEHAHWLCGECRSDIIKCQNCSKNYQISDPNINFISYKGVGVWRCYLCIPSRSSSTSINTRSWTSTVVGSGYGSTVKSERGWSSEIECYVTDINNTANNLGKLPTTFGIARDSSLRNAGMHLPDGRTLASGIEIQTPILRGKNGEIYLKDICKALNKDNNAYVDFTAGLHLHIDMSDCRKDTETIKRLLIFHWMYEPVIMSFLPSNRRANIYCQSIKNDYSFKRISNAENYADLHKIWYKNREGLSRFDKKHPRYHGINFHALFQDGHVEIRYHSGTTNSKKILQWANLHTRIIDYCMGKIGSVQSVSELISHGLTPFGRPRSLSKLTTQLFDMLQLDEESKNYFKDRQKKFVNSQTAQEVEFIEKENQEPDKENYQLSLEQYEELIRKLDNK